MKKVFLGGTCNNSKWRDKLIEKLEIEYFNPVVDNWTPECQEEELKQRKECDYCLYVITPKMTGVYSIAEVVDDSNKRPDKTIFCYLESDGISNFTLHQTKSLDMIGRMVSENGANFFTSLDDVANFLNSSNESKIKKIVVNV